MRVRGFLLVFLVAFWAALPAQAVTPDEILDDPKLEERAREISANLRCLVCQNQSIDDSDAELAKDLRVLVRERLSAGDTNAQIMEFVVDRYGEFVLLRPPLSAQNLFLWLTPVLVLLIGGLAASAFLRNRSNQTAITELSDNERERIAKLLGEGDKKAE